MHEYETRILKMLKEKGASSLEGIEKNLGIDTGSVTWALDSLTKSGAVKVTKAKAYSTTVTDEGKGYLKSFPEEELVRSIGAASGKEKLGSINAGVGLIWAKRNGWIETDKEYVRLTKTGTEAATGKAGYGQRAVLNAIAASSESGLNDIFERNKDVVEVLVRRGLLKFKEKDRISGVEITDKGVELSRTKAEEGIGDLTREIILNRSWVGKDFKKYDVNASSETHYPARQHIMHEFIDVVRNAWLSMGFSEMEGPIVENAFWVFDALFSPQDHPTRDMQDTFFLSNPKQIDIEDVEAMSRIKRAHEKGWGEEWREEIAKQALLRTHTTSVSVRHIRKFANEVEGSYPVKLFSVGRVYRNESIDYKHLAELHQTDGIIIGNNLKVSNLIDTLKRFLLQLGFDNIGIKPAYFPFVEPGIEIYFNDKKRGSTMELGGAGVIRKEITKAMGTNKTVLAWGIGVERLLMHSFEVDSITDLRRNDIGWLRERAELKM